MEIDGEPGELKTYPIDVTLTSEGIGDLDGAQGWSFAAVLRGGRVGSITVEGVRVSVLVDEDADPATPPVLSEIDLAEAALVSTGRTQFFDEGVVSSVQLPPLMTLPEGTQTVARVVLEVPIADPKCPRVTWGWFHSPLEASRPTVTSLGEVLEMYPGGSCISVVVDCLPQFSLAAVTAGSPAPEEGDSFLQRTVRPGEHLVEVEVLLTSRSTWPGTVGAQGWSLSVLHDDRSMTLKSFTLKGLEVSTIFDHDLDPLTPPLDPYLHDLWDSSHQLVQKGSGGHWGSTLPASARGVISVISLAHFNAMTLHMNTTETVLKILYAIQVAEGATTRGTVSFANGLAGQGQPFWNLTYWNGNSFTPATHSLVVEFTGTRFFFLSGDANGDGHPDLTDAVFMLENLFLGGPRPSCRRTGDLDDNGKMEVTDAIYLLNFLFLGGKPPMDYLACRSDPTPDGLSCDSYPHCEG